MTTAPTVLVLDDEEMVRENLEAFLEDEGFNVLSAPSAEDALTVVRNNAIDVGIIDMRLPGMSGHDFISEAHVISPTTRFIVHTGSTNYKLPQKLVAIGIGNDQVFIKPVADMGVLVDTIHRLLNRKEG